MRARRANKRATFAPNQKFGSWTIEEKIGSGGNGEVWRARHSHLGVAAIKLLLFSEKERFIRFKTEVRALERLRNIPGILPLIDKFIPHKLGEGTPWIAMPLAQRISEALKTHEKIQNVEYFVDLAITIREIHNLGLSHRDIKPENLLFYNGRICLGDFGLVKLPGSQAITKARRDVGPKFTMAPEMRRSAYRADGKIADVFSFAKTLWIVLSGQELGFDGQYMPASTLGLKNVMPREYTNSLDQLLCECTDNEPARRPTISEVVRRLTEWIEITQNFHKRNVREWIELEKTIFPMGLPQSAVWTDVDAICSVINAFAGVDSLIHMFYPTGGGNDVTSASRAGESGFVALHVGGRPRDIIKPKKLTFESFGFDAQ